MLPTDLEISGECEAEKGLKQSSFNLVHLRNDILLSEVCSEDIWLVVVIIIDEVQNLTETM